MVSDKQMEEQLREARRNFMKTCGKFAVVTPAAMTLLMAGSRQTYAAAGSHSGFKGRPPKGNHGTQANANFHEGTRTCSDERLPGRPDVFNERRLCPERPQLQRVSRSSKEKRADVATKSLGVKILDP